MESNHIFLSYARADSEFVLRLAKELRAKGVKIWIDQLDIKTGHRWDKAVEEALNSCETFLLVLSPAAVASENVMDEMGFALDEGKKIAPLLYQPCKAPFRIRRLQFADFTISHEHGMTRLLEFLEVPHVTIDAPATQPSPTPFAATPIPPPPESRPPAAPPPQVASAGNTSADKPQAIPMREEPNKKPRTVRKSNLVRSESALSPKRPFPLLKTTTITGVVMAVLLFVWVATKQYTGGGSPSSTPSPTPSPIITPVAETPSATFTEDLGNGVKLEMVKLPGGSFQMGSPKTEAGHEKDEEPQHKVMVAPFAIGKYEVTQSQWQEVMGNNPSYHKWDISPVERVSWDEAQEFCRKLSSKTGKSYRLPTEAEWEYACRAATTGAYAGALNEMAWYLSNSDGKAHPVGQKNANAFGLFDMHGNVWEWCQDWYGAYPSSDRTDPTGPEKGEYRVLRGGSWNYSGDAARCRSASRDRSAPDDRSYVIGVRVVQSAKVKGVRVRVEYKEPNFSGLQVAEPARTP